MAKEKIKKKGLKTWIVVMLFIVGLFLLPLGFSPATLFIEFLVIGISIFLICQKGATPKIFGIILLLPAIMIIFFVMILHTATKVLEEVSEEIENPEIIKGIVTQAVSVGNFSLVVSSVEKPNKIIKNCYGPEWRENIKCDVCQPKSNYKFVILTLTITNNGIKEDDLFYNKKEMKVDKGYIYEPASLYDCDYKEVSESEWKKYELNKINLALPILPREHTTGQIAFEIPSDTEPTNFILSCFLEPTVNIKL